MKPLRQGGKNDPTVHAAGKRHYLADALEASRALCHARDMPKNRDYTLAQDITRRQRSPNPHD